jgi:cystathionine beta-lyase/cystathionine gamma-synthase
MSGSYATSTTHKGESTYNRCFHFHERKVNEIIAKQYGIDAKNVVLTTSGIESLSFLLENIMIKYGFQKINVFYSNELYCDTPRLIKYYSQIYGSFSYYEFDVDDTKGFEEMLVSKYKNDINLVIMESCSNPTGKIFDFEKIEEIKKQTKNTQFIVDNTWLTHVCFNPFNYGADYVFSSTSKYYSGGNCIGGVIIGKDNKFMGNVTNFKRISGKHISLPYCEILLKNLPLMEKRITETFQKTLHFAEFLKSQSKVNIVHYPLLQGTPSFERANKYFGICGPSVLSFEINIPKDNAIKWMKSFRNVSYKTSFGSYETKFDTWPKDLRRTSTRCRIAIGYDSDIEAVKREFIEKLQKI